MVPRKPREERINEITQAAIDVFLEKGYENTTMDAIARRAGMSKGGLYHYFSSKDMVLISANDKISEKVEDLMKAALGCDSVREGILYYIENYICYWLEHPRETAFLFLSIAKILEKPELLTYYQEYTADYRSFLEAIFTRGVEMGEFKPHPLRTSALTLMAALDGILSYMIFDNTLNLEEVLHDFEEKFIKPIKK